MPTENDFSIGVPSSRYVDLTLLVSGATYAAPANGWYIIQMQASDVGQNLGIFLKDDNITIGGFFSNAFTATASIGYMMPIKKGEIIQISYTCTVLEFFRFVYAEGQPSIIKY